MYLEYRVCAKKRWVLWKRVVWHRIIIKVSYLSCFVCVYPTPECISRWCAFVCPKRLAKVHLGPQNQPPHSSSHLSFPDTDLPPRPARILLCHAIFISQLRLAEVKAVTIPLPRLYPFPASRRGSPGSGLPRWPTRPVPGRRTLLI